MKIIAKTSKHEIATVYIAESNGDLIEFAESTQPPLPLMDKWILIISTMVGCPIKCKICDAGNSYTRKLSKEEIFSQINLMITKKFENKKNIPIKKLKIQFSRVGEPTLNHAVLQVLELLANYYNIPKLIPAISTVAPNCSKTKDFLNKLIELKNKFYNAGNFQLQFSIHSTNEKVRDFIIPIKKWDLATIAGYGEKFFTTGDRKITLNFALSAFSSLDVKVLQQYFDSNKFLIKITPVNPTLTANKNHLNSVINNNNLANLQPLLTQLKQANYETIISIGELEENKIGSNCGQYLKTFLQNYHNINIADAYKYQLEYL